MAATFAADESMSRLADSNRSLLEAHDCFLVDLDGVVYLGDRPIEGAAEALSVLRDAGRRVVFVTNNAARPPAVVADQLVSMGVAATPSDVMTSAVAAARELAVRLPTGAPVLVVGGPGVRDALLAVGLRPVESATDDPVAVVQGFGPDVGWKSLAEASIALRAGAQWIATNIDITLPSPRGPLPGNGSLVAALCAATGLRPEVIGKPEPALYAAALADGDNAAALAVGDRLDTDIAGARAAGLPSLLVLSGVSSAGDLIAAGPSERPSYLGRDLRALRLTHPGSQASDGVATCGAARAGVVDGAVTVKISTDGATPDGLDGLRALCALAWASESAARSNPLPGMYSNALKTLDLD
jgi:glycerol 3-phosphatase-2